MQEDLRKKEAENESSASSLETGQSTRQNTNMLYKVISRIFLQVNVACLEERKQASHRFLILGLYTHFLGRVGRSKSTCHHCSGSEREHFGCGHRGHTWPCIVHGSSSDRGPNDCPAHIGSNRHNYRWFRFHSLCAHGPLPRSQRR